MNSSDSDWEINERCATHKSGFRVIVIDGSFSNPLTITIRGGQEFDSLKVASLIREGLKTGKNSEKQSRYSFMEYPEEVQLPVSTTKVTLKKRRCVPSL